MYLGSWQPFILQFTLHCGIRSGCKPGPVLLENSDGHPSWVLVTEHLQRPTRRAGRTGRPPAPGGGLLFLFGLAPDGVCLLFTLETGNRFRYRFCGTVPALLHQGFPLRPALWSPDFPRNHMGSRDRPPGRILSILHYLKRTVSSPDNIAAAKWTYISFSTLDFTGALWRYFCKTASAGTVLYARYDFSVSGAS